MQKIIVLFLILFGFSHAESWFDQAYGLWGVGAVSRDRNYKGVDVDITPGVFIFGGFGPIFIEANRFGYSFYKDGTYFASIAAQIRSHQFRKKEEGLGERKIAFEAGLQIGRRLPAGIATRIAFLHDISGTHKSWELDWQIYRRNRLGSLRLLTAIGVQYQNKELVDYYYGTSGYVPDESFVGELEIIATYPVGNFAIFAGTRIYVFDNEVKKSPLTNKSDVTQFFTGVGYSF
jgi:outer membrane scaffolding protein for murein synthesis (MipA/OmpV family)